MIFLPAVLAEFSVPSKFDHEYIRAEAIPDWISFNVTYQGKYRICIPFALPPFSPNSHGGMYKQLTHGKRTFSLCFSLSVVFIAVQNLPACLKDAKSKGKFVLLNQLVLFQHDRP